MTDRSVDELNNLLNEAMALLMRARGNLDPSNDPFIKNKAQKLQSAAATGTAIDAFLARMA